MQGKVGKDLTTEQAYDAAKYCALAILGTLKQELGDLDKVKKVVKITGFVNCIDTFAAQPKVLNGASDLLGQVLGERGVHSRSAVGTNALPLNVPVEVEAIVEVKE
jgi:enamine deaminase RidA (YjgF/YER057c/UK114 family)